MALVCASKCARDPTNRLNDTRAPSNGIGSNTTGVVASVLPSQVMALAFVHSGTVPPHARPAQVSASLVTAGPWPSVVRTASSTTYYEPSECPRKPWRLHQCIRARCCCTMGNLDSVSFAFSTGTGNAAASSMQQLWVSMLQPQSMRQAPPVAPTAHVQSSMSSKIEFP